MSALSERRVMRFLERGEPFLVKSSSTQRRKVSPRKVHVAHRDSYRDLWLTICGLRIETGHIEGFSLERVTCAKCTEFVPLLERHVEETYLTK